MSEELQPQSSPSFEKRHDLVPRGLTENASITEYLDGEEFSPVGATEGMASAAPFSWSRLFRRKWLMMGVFVLFAGAAIPLIWTVIKSKYSSTAVIRVRPVVSRIVFKTEDNGIVPLYKSYLNTQVHLIGGPTVLQRVLDRSSIQNTQWYKQEVRSIMGDPISPLERLDMDLRVQSRRNTELIDVSIATGQAKDSKKIVDAVVDEYKKLVDQTLRQSDIDVLETLRKTHASLQRDIEGLIETKYRLSKQIGTLDSIELQTQLSIQLSGLESQHHHLMRQIEMARWQLDQFPKAVAGSESIGESQASPADKSNRRYADDAEWRQHHLVVQNARHQLELGRQRYGEAHPAIKQAIITLAHTEGLLQEREKQLEGQWLRTVGTSTPGQTLTQAQEPAISFHSKRALEDFIPVRQKEAELLLADINQQRSRVADVSEVARQVAQYEAKIRHKRELYEAVHKRLEVLEMEGKAPASIQVASYGLESSQPVGDRRIVLSLLALIGAVVTAVASGYLRSSTDTKIHEVNEVRHIGRVPFLGQLPGLSRSHIPLELGGSLRASTAKSANELAVANSHFASNSCQVLMESIRMIRTSLLERVHTTGEQVILITSPGPGGGKTSTTVLLAESLSVVGKKVLVVEADFRRPVLGNRLQIESGEGLAALLSGEVTEDQAITHTHLASFDVIPVGDIPASFDTEILVNGEFSGCISRWKKMYDFVIIDSPPVLPVADARILAGHADGTIMVLRSSHDRRPAAIEAYAQLSASGGRLLGTVLVGGERYDKSYGYSYEYSKV